MMTVRHRLFRVMSALSLLILLLTLALRIRSHGRNDFAFMTCERLGLSLITDEGRLQFKAVWYHGSPGSSFHTSLFDDSLQLLRDWLWEIPDPLVTDDSSARSTFLHAGSGSSYFGGLQDRSSGPDFDYWFLAGPFWLPLVIFTLPPAWWLTSRCLSRRARVEGTFCRCGYDLRATSDRCPECGRPVIRKKTVVIGEENGNPDTQPISSSRNSL